MRWLNATRAGELLDIHRHKVPEVARAAGIRTRKLPGQKFVSYSAEDVERVARESIIEPGRVENARAS